MPAVERGTGSHRHEPGIGRRPETERSQELGGSIVPRNSENARTNLACVRWQEMRNLFSKLKFGQKYKTNWGLVQNWRFLGNIRVTVRTMSEP